MKYLRTGCRTRVNIPFLAPSWSRFDKLTNVNHTSAARRKPPVAGAVDAASRVAAVTVAFWVIKVLSTAMGEATSDLFVHTIGPVPGVALGFILFAVTIVLHFTARRFSTARYWAAIVGVSVFGTMVADVAHVGFGIPYLVSALICAVVLAAIFVVWHRTEGTISIHSITTRRREVFYWLAVLVTFALGTAVGDLTATTFGLGYFLSGVIFAVAIAIPAVAFRITRMLPVAMFWTAYVLTRPLGASFADWFGVDKQRGGLDFGSGLVAIILTVAIVIMVAATATARAPRRAHAADRKRANRTTGTSAATTKKVDAV